MSAFGSPLPGLTSWPRTYGQRRSASHTHQGLDFNVREGTPVFAIAAGTVVHASNQPIPGFGGYGRVVVLRFRDADGRDKYALYAHLKRVDVHEGQQVALGHVLGQVGRSQFRSAASFRRSGRGVPAGFTTANDDAGRYVARGGRPMSAHLHFELATAAYPMGPEAPNRIDPRQWAIERGVFGGAAPAPRPAAPPRLQAANTRRRVPPVAGNMTAAQLDAFRAAVVAAVGATEPRIMQATTSIRASGLPGAEVAAGLVAGQWTQSRAAILAAVQASDVGRLRAAVHAWIEKLHEYGGRARGLGFVQASDMAEQLRRMWTELLARVERAARGAVAEVRAGVERYVDRSVRFGGAVMWLVVLAALAFSERGK